MDHSACQSEDCHRRQLYVGLAAASFASPRTFSETALAVLLDTFPLRAASFFSFNSFSRVLQLRGQVGCTYEDYGDFRLSLRSLAGDAIASGSVVTATDLQEDPRFRGRSLAQRYGLTSIIAVPLKFPTDQRPDRPLGVLCLYPRPNQDLEPLASAIAEVAEFIAELYMRALENHSLSLRRELLQRIGYSSDLGSLAHRAAHALKACLGVNGVSLFIRSGRDSTLHLEGTTGLRPRSDESIPPPKQSVRYLSDSHDPTNVSFRANQWKLLNASEASKITPIEESPSIREVLLIPIIEAVPYPGQAPQVLGVLRAVNKFADFGGNPHPTGFGWEDLRHARSLLGLFATCVHFVEKGTEGHAVYNRMMHGAKNTLGAALNLLNEAIPNLASRDLSDSVAHHVSDAAAYLEDLRFQVRRVELRSESQHPRTPIRLYGEVLAKVAAWIEPMARTYPFGRFRVTNLKEAGFINMPLVLANAEAALCVFRNLAENAVKYGKRDGSENAIEIRFSQSDDGRWVDVSFTDFGIGIPPIDTAHLFREGFRSEVAMRRWPSGLGQGLYDARQIMNELGGKIWFAPDAPGTTFVVRFESAKGEHL